MLTVFFSATLFVSAGLVFLVEPMNARMVLPLWGGIPAVWNPWVVFFQAAMLGGYAYAHLAMSWLTQTQRRALHALALVAAALVPPLPFRAAGCHPRTPDPHELLKTDMCLAHQTSQGMRDTAS
jgi:hypothetical protein